MKKYADIRSQIKTGDLLAWRDSGTGTFQAMVERYIVRLTTTSPHTHVGLAWVEAGRVWVIEITTHGCAPRPLSLCGNFDWIPAPAPLKDEALAFAFSCFGVWRYSKWQAIMGRLKRLVIGADAWGQCAEFCLAVLARSGMAPTDIATPADVVEGALFNWDAPLIAVENKDVGVLS